MKTQIKGRNVTVTDALELYAEEKVERVHKLLQQRRIDEVTRVELELMVEKNPSIPEPCVAEATIFTRGPVIRARESATDMYAAIDLVMDKLTRQTKKYHDKVHGKTRRGRERLAVEAELPVEAEPVLEPVAVGAPAEGAVEEEFTEEHGLVIKSKQFVLKPMSVHEATLQLELVGHDFFVFTNAESNRTCVVYRRNDGNFGLIEPSES